MSKKYILQKFNLILSLYRIEPLGIFQDEIALTCRFFLNLPPNDGSKYVFQTAACLFS